MSIIIDILTTIMEPIFENEDESFSIEFSHSLKPTPSCVLCEGTGYIKLKNSNEKIPCICTVDYNVVTND